MEKSHYSRSPQHTSNIRLEAYNPFNLLDSLLKYPYFYEDIDILYPVVASIAFREAYDFKNLPFLSFRS